ncbi:MAG: ribosome biogenesis GTP-binding protein YihA/YsxC [Ruminococcus sp.]|jgi:GTP-binding protein|nr:ribosome biogenesis GTP-binding protein YihA/YsxC [Ruminococcus sp.]
MNFEKIEFNYAAGTVEQIPDTNMPEIVFSGHSNVGKSSLINKLARRKKLARVSSQPGKTATINYYKGENFYFVDLPGYGYAKVSKAEKARWADLVEGYLSTSKNIALIIQIIDLRHKPTKDDYDMIRFLYESNAPFVIVLTKKDKLKKTAYEKRINEALDELEEFEGTELIPFSAVSGEGLDDVKEVIEEYINSMED